MTATATVTASAATQPADEGFPISLSRLREHAVRTKDLQLRRWIKVLTAKHRHERKTIAGWQRQIAAIAASPAWPGGR